MDIYSSQKLLLFNLFLILPLHSWTGWLALTTHVRNSKRRGCTIGLGAVHDNLLGRYMPAELLAGKGSGHLVFNWGPILVKISGVHRITSKKDN
jgi:hypothetical protein